MIILSDVTLRFGARVLFDHISATFPADQKIGIVGRNGTGKSTLLKVITGECKIDSGAVSIDRHTKIAYMAQEMTLSSTKKVYDEAFSVFQKFTTLEERIAEIEHLLASAPAHAEELLEEYSSCQEKLGQFDRPTAVSRTHEILNGLGFSDTQKEQTVDTLSVGWRMRVVLAQLLLQDADFYLFDEPTNHLDIITREWFLRFLREASFGYLLITHDRYYLQKACDKILELSMGKAIIYHGNFDAYEVQKAERKLTTQSAYERQQKEISRKKATIDRFRASASKAKMAQSMMKQLDKIEQIEIEKEESAVTLNFPPCQRPGKIVLLVKDLAHSFDGKKLFENVNFEINRGQKVALIAPNGAGKTTLFNLITGKLKRQEGKIEFGYQVESAYFEQDQTRVLKPTNSIVQEVSDACPNIPDGTIRGFLGAFLFSGEDAYKKIDVLSGGERNRVAMVKVLLQKANFLILDEPTNHLDLFTKDILLQALQQYTGTILIVSHDHSFIQGLADTIIELTPEGSLVYPGTYEEFLADKKQQEKAVTSPTRLLSSEKDDAKDADGGSKNTFDTRKEIRRVEQRVQRLEADRDRYAEQLTELDYGTPAYQKIMKSIEQAEKELSALSTEWEMLMKQI